MDTNSNSIRCPSLSVVICIVVVFLFPLSLYGQITIQGKITDKATGLSLPSAYIHIEGTFNGTVSNESGKYVLYLETVPAKIQISYIGYKAHTQEIDVDSGRIINIALEPTVYQIEETVVSAEDPAVEIMRNVIRNKMEWFAVLDSYQAESYTYQSISNDTTVAVIRQAVLDIYWSKEKGIRQVMRSNQSTENERFFSFVTFWIAPNFYQDYIELQGNQVIGPTHPNALDHYTFELVSEKMLDEKIVYEITLMPKNRRLSMGFVGTVWVLDEEFALIEVDLKANEVIESTPMVASEGFSIVYRQQFRSFGRGVWLPVDLRYSIKAKIGTVGLHFPPMFIKGVSRLSKYKLNIDIPDSLYDESAALQIDTLATRNDSLFNAYPDKVPLGIKEQEAYTVLDSTYTFIDFFRPEGALVGIVGPFFKNLDPAEQQSADEERDSTRVLRAELSYNRVDALRAGLVVEQRLTRSVKIGLNGGYSTGIKRTSYGGEFSFHLGRDDWGQLRVGYNIGTRSRYSSYLYSSGVNSLPVLWGEDDYFDYYWNRRLYAEWGYTSERKGSEIALMVNDEAHSSLAKSTDFSLLQGDKNKRSNPMIEEGTLRSVGVALRLGDGLPSLGVFPNKRIELKIEHSPRSIFDSDYPFTTYRLSVDWYIKTLFRRRTDPQVLTVRLVAGLASGGVPAQRFGIVDASYRGWTPYGTLRTLRGIPYEGEQYWGFFWEYDIRALPFEFLGLGNWRQRGMGVVLHGAFARSWIGKSERAGLSYAPREATEFHQEIGLSLRVYNMLRLDYSKRVDQSGWTIGVSVARLDFIGI